MNPHHKLLRSGFFLFFVVSLWGLLSGCGSSSREAYDWPQAGADVLHGLAIERFNAGWEGRNEGYFGSGATWTDDFVARLDEDRFPDWARDEYAACVYWEQGISYSAMNRERQRGEPAQYTFDGKCWGWIVLNEETFQVLELGIQFEDSPYLFVDAWEPSPA